MSSQSVDVPAQEPGQLREYLAILRLRKWSILIVTLLVVGAALAFSARQTPMYQSSTSVLVKPISIAGSSITGQVQEPNLQTESELVSSSAIATRVAKKLGFEGGASEATKNLAVEVVQGTEILLITLRSPDPELAQRAAAAFAGTYLDFRRDQVLDELDAASEAIRKNIEVLEEEQQLAEEEAEQAPPNSTERLRAEAKAASYTSEITAQGQQLTDLTNPQDLQVGQVVEPASLPTAPVSPDLVRNGIIALVVGLLLAVGIAFLRERLDDRLRGRADLEQQLGAPVLAVIPKVPSWRKPRETPLVTVSEPRSPSSEAYRTLRTSLLFAASQRGAKVLLVTSPRPGEGKTTTCANLAIVLAQARKRVLLISADLRKPRLHRFFGVPNDVGLTSVLIGEAKPWEAVVDVGLEHLKLVPSGPVPGNPAELLGSDAMGRLLAQFREVAEFVVLDSAPGLVVADALTLARFADAALFVADAENTSRSAVAHARTGLEQVDANVIGGVLNAFDVSKAKSVAYYYSYYYSYEYGEAPQRGDRLRRRRTPKEPAPFLVQEGQQVTNIERIDGLQEEAAGTIGAQAAESSRPSPMEGLWAPVTKGSRQTAAHEPEGEAGRSEVPRRK